jgi:hypothetical protein
MHKRQTFAHSSSAGSGGPPRTLQEALHAHSQPGAVGTDASAPPSAEDRPEEVLITDARAHLTPAQMVEQRLFRLLARASGVIPSSGLLHRASLRPDAARTAA